LVVPVQAKDFHFLEQKVHVFAVYYTHIPKVSLDIQILLLMAGSVVCTLAQHAISSGGNPGILSFLTGIKNDLISLDGIRSHPYAP
jgi:hypothetical protein